MGNNVPMLAFTMSIKQRFYFIPGGFNLGTEATEISRKELCLFTNNTIVSVENPMESTK